VDALPVSIPTASLGEWANKYLNYSTTKFYNLTFREKRDVFKRFFSMVSPDIPVDDFAANDALAYLQAQTERRTGHAANKDRKNLVAAWNWAIKLHDFPLNPFIKVERFAETRHPRYVPPEDDFWRVYEVAEGQDKVMLFSYLHLAARRTELFRLTWADVDFANECVRLGTRKRRDGMLEFDLIPMTSELREEFRDWWETRPVKDTSFVFVCLDVTAFTRSYYGKPFEKRQHLMERLCIRAGVKPFGFHAIRHLTASTLYHAGQPVAVIQSILRHKSPATTERYLRSLGLEHTREALESVLVKKGPARVIPFVKQEAPKALTSGA
jgi:integrase